MNNFLSALQDLIESWKENGASNNEMKSALQSEAGKLPADEVYAGHVEGAGPLPDVSEQPAPADENIGETAEDNTAKRELGTDVAEDESKAAE